MLSMNKNWTSLIKPSQVQLVNNKPENFTSDIVIEPLERGFGLTLGNALRRVLLSSLQGAAIVSVKIPTILHEFTSPPGVKEDMVDVILNLKKISVKLHNAETKTLRLSVKGPCVVTAEMIQTDQDADILNKDQVICTLSKDSELEMELNCSLGRGYIPSFENRDKNAPIGVIPIDALFSPVTKVSYRVEDTRVGQITDYDKLILSIQTDGTITPETALALASRILQDQLQVFINFEEEEEVKQEVQEDLDFNPVLLKKVSHLELSVRSQNCLQNDNIVYIGDLVIKSEGEMLRTQNFGRKSLNEIKDILSKFKLKFGMDIPGWPPDNVEELAKNHEDPYQ
jgi:DNA-directed RNA polymerase subunit alpha